MDGADAGSGRERRSRGSACKRVLDRVLRTSIAEENKDDPDQYEEGRQEVLDQARFRVLLATDLFGEGVRRIREAGRLRVADADVAAQTSWAACHGIVSLLLTRPQISFTKK